MVPRAGASEDTIRPEAEVIHAGVIQGDVPCLSSSTEPTNDAAPQMQWVDAGAQQVCLKRGSVFIDLVPPLLPTPDITVCFAYQPLDSG